MGRVSDAKQRLMDAVQELIRTSSYGRTTVDQICDKAQVKKGSFYHFFNDKANLAEEALEAEWQKSKRFYDTMFSPTVPPLERIRRYCDDIFESQSELKHRYGKVLGCSLCTLGSEVCTQEISLRTKIQQIRAQHRKYLESAIREAHAIGEISAPDAAAKAQIVYAYHDGLLTQARIQNDVEVLRDLADGTLGLLGIEKSAHSGVRNEA